jgi:hypothetical protein
MQQQSRTAMYKDREKHVWSETKQKIGVKLYVAFRV